jgi:hypothetical protein
VFVGVKGLVYEGVRGVFRIYLLWIVCFYN